MRTDLYVIMFNGKPAKDESGMYRFVDREDAVHAINTWKLCTAAKKREVKISIVKKAFRDVYVDYTGRLA